MTLLRDGEGNGSCGRAGAKSGKRSVKTAPTPEFVAAQLPPWALTIASNDREAEPGTALSPRARRVGAGEAVEDSLERFGR